MTSFAHPRFNRLLGIVARPDGRALPPRAPCPQFQGNRVSTRNGYLSQFA